MRLALTRPRPRGATRRVALARSALLLSLASVHVSPLVSPLVSWAEDAPRDASVDPTLCPKRVHHKGPPEGTSAELLHLNYWRDRWAAQVDLNEPLLFAPEIREHNEALMSGAEGLRGQIDLAEPLDLAEVRKLSRGRLDYMLDLFNRGEYVKRSEGKLSPLTPRDLQLFKRQLPAIGPTEYRVALRGIQILCGPLLSEIERVTWDRSIDRNACTQIRPQALVQVIGEWSDELLLVRTRLAMGWISKRAPLSPPVPPELRAHYLRGPFLYAPRAVRALGRADLLIPAEARAPRAPVHDGDAARDESSTRALIATASGFERWDARGVLTPAPTTLTRGAVLERLFSHLHKGYGLGGMGGQIDCSRVLIDSLEPFGLNVPRYSGHQAKMGSWSVDISEVRGREAREHILDLAFQRGLTILYIPGHMMLYLGRDHLGVPRSLHALSDYQRVCEGGGETTVDIKRVSVTDLQRGAGSSKGAYLDRITRVVVLGNSGPGAALRERSPARVIERPTRPLRVNLNTSARGCPSTSNEAHLFVTPKELNTGESVRVAVTHPRAELLGQLALLTPQGEVRALKPTRFGGPPYVLHAESGALDQAGAWRVVFGEGQNWRACAELSVSLAPSASPAPDPVEADAQAGSKADGSSSESTSTPSSPTKTR